MFFMGNLAESMGMNKSDLQRARLDLLVAKAKTYCLSVSEATITAAFRPAFEYLEKLEAEAAQITPIESSGGNTVEDEFNYLQWHERSGEVVTLNREDSRWVWDKLCELKALKDTFKTKASGAEFTASLAPHFKAELSRICVETDKPLSDWAVGTGCGGIKFGNGMHALYEFSDKRDFDDTHSRDGIVLGRFQGKFERLGLIDLAGRDPATTWKEYPKADK